MRFFFLWIDFLHKWWMRFAHALGYVNSRIILGLIYIVVIGIYAVCIQFFSFIRKIQRSKETLTYWNDVEGIRDIREDLSRQF